MVRVSLSFDFFTYFLFLSYAGDFQTRTTGVTIFWDHLPSLNYVYYCFFVFTLGLHDSEEKKNSSSFLRSKVQLNAASYVSQRALSQTNSK